MPIYSTRDLAFRAPVAHTATVQHALNAKDYKTILTTSDANPKFINAVTTSVAQNCYKESMEKRLGWGHSIKKALACTTAYVIPPVTITSLAYYYRNEIMTTIGKVAMDAAWSIGSTMDLKTACEAALGIGTSYVVNDQLDKRAGIRPTALIAHYITHLFGGAVNKLADATCNSVARSYRRQEQAVEELTKRNHEEKIHSLTKKWNGIADLIRTSFENAKTIEEQFDIENGIKELINKLPAIINKSFASIGVSTTEAATILEQLNEVLSGISVSLDLDMDETPEALAYNYGLLVNLPAEKGIAHCVPTVVQDYLEEAKCQKLGWSYTAKSAMSAVGVGVFTAISVPVATVLAFKASELAGYVKPLAEVPMSYVAATGLTTVTTAGTLVKRKWNLYQKTQANAQNKVRESMKKAQDSLKKVFDGVAESYKKTDKETILARLPEWEKEIKKYPELDAESALAVLRKNVSL